MDGKLVEFGQRGPAEVRDVETDWNPAALAIRVRRAIGSDEPVRVLLRDGTAHTGRIVQLHRDATERDGTTLAL